MTPPWEGLKLAAWDADRPERTVLDVGTVRIGAGLAVLAGLSCRGDRDLIVASAKAARAAGAHAFRWTDPEAGAEEMNDPAGRMALVRGTGGLAGLPMAIEVTDTKDVVPASEAADVLLVGAANMQNFSLLKELGRSSAKPVILVRGWHATLKEWLNSAEYVLFEGNPRVILCEAGIRSFDHGSRVILDLSAVPAVKAVSHLPVLVDLDGIGGAEETERMGLAAIAAGADGLLIDVAPDAPGPAAGSTGLSLAEFARLVPRLEAMSQLTEGPRIARD